MFSLFNVLIQRQPLADLLGSVDASEATVFELALHKDDTPPSIYDVVESAIEAGLDTDHVDGVVEELVSVLARRLQAFVYYRDAGVILFQQEVVGPLVRYQRLEPDLEKDGECLFGHEMPNRMLGTHERSYFRATNAESLNGEFAHFHRVLNRYLDHQPSERRGYLHGLSPLKEDESDASALASEFSIRGIDEFRLCPEQCGLLLYWGGQWFATEAAAVKLESVR